MTDTVDRGERAALIGMAQTLAEILSTLQRIETKLGAVSDERSSVEFDSNASAGKLKTKVKEYAPTSDEARKAAELSFARAMATLENAQLAGWAATVDALQDRQSVTAQGGGCLCEHAIRQETGRPIQHDRRCQFFGGRVS